MPADLDGVPLRRLQGAPPPPPRHATAMLAAALPVAAAPGVTGALLTCNETNTASRRVIEANGGRLVAADGGKLRYLVPTTA
ncbi:hypothetical protein [Streptomyces sp. CBMA123]|uniref:hypothetical protein n=1 Tax=Streptomyces sp. CBMA123 TaxID=1896313 RepID=UPI001661D840|nr:hypothetical protein [Streptomyces sp. CBMA123]